jgi:hypothetical protein
MVVSARTSLKPRRVQELERAIAGMVSLFIAVEGFAIDALRMSANSLTLSRGAATALRRTQS